MSRSKETLARLVRERARGRSEFCRMHSALQGAEFHIDHVIPTSKGGSDEFDNLALACVSCNLVKSDHLSFVDPETSIAVTAFNPRLNEWNDHFRIDAHQLFGLTPIGRATIAALKLNSPNRILIRTAEELLGLYPPDDESRTGMNEAKKDR